MSFLFFFLSLFLAHVAEWLCSRDTGLQHLRLSDSQNDQYNFFSVGYLVLLRVPNPCSCYVLPGLGLEKLDFDVKFIHNTAINPYFMCSKPLNSDKNDTGGGNQDFGKKSGLCFGMG